MEAPSGLLIKQINQFKGIERMAHLWVNIKILLPSVFILLIVSFRHTFTDDSPLYKFVLKDIHGDNVNMEIYKGKVNNIKITYSRRSVFIL